MPIAYVMRGIPGSGKSTWLQRNAHPLTEVASADTYHLDPLDGLYKFKPENIKLAHDSCLKAFVHEIVNQKFFAGSPRDIAVSNTNIRVWEVAPYVRLAEAYGFEVKIIRMVCNPKIAIARNVHGVPPEQIWKMYTEFENLPTHWRETPVFNE